MRFTIKLKLGLAFGLIVLLMIGATGYGLTSLRPSERVDDAAD